MSVELLVPQQVMVAVIIDEEKLAQMLKSTLGRLWKMIVENW